MAILEGTILLANLIGNLSKTASDGVYRFEHRLIANRMVLSTYTNYLNQRLSCGAPWSSSAGCAFRPVEAVAPLPDGTGFSVLVRPYAPEA